MLRCKLLGHKHHLRFDGLKPVKWCSRCGHVEGAGGDVLVEGK